MDNFNTKEKKKLHNIFLVLSGIFITNAIIAEILGTKIFDVNIVKNFSLSVGVIIWPVVFITTDIINEYFGKKGVKRISYFTILLIIYVFIIIFLSTKLTPNSYWLDVNKFDNSGNLFNINYAIILFSASTGIIIGSILLFYSTTFRCIHFQKIKK